MERSIAVTPSLTANIGYSVLRAVFIIIIILITGNDREFKTCLTYSISLCLIRPQRRSQLDIFGELPRVPAEGLPIVSNKLLLFGLQPLMILEGGPEDEIHHERLIGDDDGEQQNGVLLGLSFEVVDEVEQKMAIVDDFPEEEGLIHEEL